MSLLKLILKRMNIKRRSCLDKRLMTEESSAPQTISNVWNLHDHKSEIPRRGAIEINALICWL